MSVGLPVYNGERYVRVAIESILNQTLHDWELIICDNASIDGTEAICREYAAREPRIRYHRLPANIGAANNYCRALELARAAYFKWVAADDYVGPIFLERCMQVLQASPGAVLCTMKVDMVDGDGLLTHHYSEPQELLQSRASERMIACLDQDSWCNALYGVIRTPVLRHVGGMRNYVGSDAVLLAELSLYGHFVELPEYQLFRRYHPGAYSYNVNLEKMKDFYTPSKRHGTGLVFRHWRHLAEYARAVSGAPLTIGEKLRLYLYIVRMLWWRKRTLGAEVVAAMRVVAGRGAIGGK